MPSRSRAEAVRAPCQREREIRNQQRLAETADDAKKAADRFRFPVVVKADGPAAGKGVVIGRSAAKSITPTKIPPR